MSKDAVITDDNEQELTNEIIESSPLVDGQITTLSNGVNNLNKIGASMNDEVDDDINMPNEYIPLTEEKDEQDLAASSIELQLPPLKVPTMDMFNAKGIEVIYFTE